MASAAHGGDAPAPPEEESDMRTDMDSPAQTEQRRNDLQNYILDMREKTLSGGELGEFMSDTGRQEYHERMAKVEEWMRDTKDATRSMYSEKIDELNATGDLIVWRREESLRRAEWIGALTGTISNYKKVALNPGKGHAHISPDKLGKIVAECDNATAWLKDLEAKQEGMAKHEKPVLICAWVEQKNKDLAKFANVILSEPRPKPKPPVLLKVKKEEEAEDPPPFKVKKEKEAEDPPPLNVKKEEEKAQDAAPPLKIKKEEEAELKVKKEEEEEEAESPPPLKVKKEEEEEEAELKVKKEEAAEDPPPLKVEKEEEAELKVKKEEEAEDPPPLKVKEEEAEDLEDLEKLTVIRLKGRLKEANLPVSGNKAELVARLQDHYARAVRAEAANLKMEFKAEVKMEVKQEVKQEIKQEVKEELEDVKVKQEPDESDGESRTGLPPDHGVADAGAATSPDGGRAEEEVQLVKVKVELQDRRFDNPSSFAARLPMWINMCIDFQKEKKTWAPARPCCLPCFYQDEPAAPPRDELTACYHRLTKEQRREFRDFIESGQSDHKWQGTFCTRVWDSMLHPELVKRRRPPKGPIKRRRPGFREWNCDLPWFEYELPGWAWKGNGWMMTDDGGRRRIRPTFIAPGAEVFEGRGKAKVPRRAAADSASDDPYASSDEATAGQQQQQQPGPAAAAAAESGAAPAEPRPSAAEPAAPPLAEAAVLAGYARGSPQANGKRIVAARQSGVPGVNWSVIEQCWQAQWWSCSEGAKSQRRKKIFPVAKFQQPGRSPEAADAAALQAAIAFRQELERSGQAKAPKAAERQSGVPGVCWHPKGSWFVRIDGRKGSKSIHGGYFTPEDDTPEEVERARLLAVERLRELEREQGRAVEVRDGAAAPRVARQSGVPGVTWHKANAAWYLHYTVKCGPDKGRTKQPRFRPQDDSPEEVERARLAAVEALQKMREDDRAPGRVAAGGRGARGRRAGRGRAE